MASSPEDAARSSLEGSLIQARVIPPKGRPVRIGDFFNRAKRVWRVKRCRSYLACQEGVRLIALSADQDRKGRRCSPSEGQHSRCPYPASGPRWWPAYAGG